MLNSKNKNHKKNNATETQKPARTELVFILDRSGSMSGLEADTIGGYNSLLAKQKKAAGEATVTTVLFDDRYELLHDRIDIRGVAPITEQDYYVRGCTALLDAIGRTVQKIRSVQEHTAPDRRADKVVVVITTDGMENASREYTLPKVRKLVEEVQEKYGWEFLFLGANIDAISAAGGIGIRAERAVNYHADARGTQLNFEAVNDAVSAVRCCAAMPVDWKARIEEDYESRK